jgi:hypothetical protein
VTEKKKLIGVRSESIINTSRKIALLNGCGYQEKKTVMYRVNNHLFRRNKSKVKDQFREHI